MVDLNQKKLRDELASHAIQREQFENHLKNEIQKIGYTFRSLSSGRSFEEFFYKVVFENVEGLFSMKMKMKNEKKFYSKEDLDKILNKIQNDVKQCKCEVKKPDPNIWILDSSQCDRCHLELI